MQEKVSVIIPMYNSEKTILTCLKSVKNQTYKNIEVIIINDGSQDRSQEIVEKYIMQNNLTTWRLINQKNHGVSFSRNMGIQESIGEFIAFLDTDDSWNCDKLSKQIHFLKKHQQVFIASLSNRQNISENNMYREYTFKDMLISNKVITSSVLIRTDIIKEFNGFNEFMKYSEDYNLWLKISRKYPIYILQEKLGTYKTDISVKGLSTKLWKMEIAELSNFWDLYKRNFIKFIPLCFYMFYSFMKFIKRCIFSKI